jgi:dipeptidase D
VKVRFLPFPRVSLLALLPLTVGCTAEPRDSVPSPLAREIAEYAVRTYSGAAVETLEELVGFRTFHPADLEYTENPEFHAMRDYLAQTAEEFGFDFQDKGPLVVIGLGNSTDRIGVVAHGDVQPVDPAKWASDPFTLDSRSEPGRLVGRGTEDDKGPLVNALYAMKSLMDRQVPLAGRIELIVSWTEEWDWDPIRKLLETWEPPQINIAFDASYPVVVAEKGWGQIKVTFPEPRAPTGSSPALQRVTGGSFLSQVPEDATAEIANASAELQALLEHAAFSSNAVDFDFDRQDGLLVVSATGDSAHSSVPWNGRNALTHLAALLERVEWPETAASQTVRFINDLVGTGDYAEKFGDLAYSDPFMGPLTLTLATVKENDSTSGGFEVGISFRRPAGRMKEEVEASIKDAIESWKKSTGLSALTYETEIYNPYSVTDAPQVPLLLDIFRHYTGIEDAEPIAMGGGTNASLLPYGVSFGPSMPGAVYTGHTEHEFITREQFRRDLEMYTAALTELAAE